MFAFGKFYKIGCKETSRFLRSKGINRSKTLINGSTGWLEHPKDYDQIQTTIPYKWRKLTNDLPIIHAICVILMSM